MAANIRSFFWSVERVIQVARSVMEHPLHRKRKIKSLLRLAALTASSRLTPTRKIFIPYIESSVLSWSREATSVMICARSGLGEYADMAFLLHLLRGEDLFCDVGANAGVYTVLAGGAVGSKVVAIEPIESTFNILMENVYANGISRKVEALNIAVGAETEVLNFTSDLCSYNHVVFSADEAGVCVDSWPLDLVLAGRVPLAIKIDVEGFEGQVVAGARQLLQEPGLQAVVIEVLQKHLTRYGGEVASVVSLFREAGFSGPYWYDPVQRELVAPGKQERRKCNQIFVKNTDFVMERLQSSRSYLVHGVMV